MKTIEIKLYSFNELSNAAKEVAKNEVKYNACFDEDIRNSYNAAKELYLLFDTENIIKGERLYKFIQNNIFPELTAKRLYKKGCKYYTNRRNSYKGERLSNIFVEIDACNLTGYCNDYDFLAPIFDYMENFNPNITSDDFLETDLNLIAERIQEDEINNFYEDNNFAEYCENNEIYFLENGKQFKTHASCTN